MSRLRFDRDTLPVGRARRFHWREVARMEFMVEPQRSVEAQRAKVREGIDAGVVAFILPTAPNAPMIPVFRDEDVETFAWDWPDRAPFYGEGRYVYRENVVRYEWRGDFDYRRVEGPDWVRP